MQEQSDCILQMHQITKCFGALQVLKDVDFTLRRGEIMALMGENGAGKSTLMKILTGIQPYNAGNIVLHGKPYQPKTPLDAENNGIVMIHQELSLFDELTVLDNVFFGSEILKHNLWIDYAQERRILQELFTKLHITLDPSTLVKDLSIGQKQLVEIAKALRKNAQILVMDEPTSALTEEEIERVFAILMSLKKKGVAIIYISHRMQEIYQICDRISVLRDGQFMGEYSVKDLPENKLIALMVGRDIQDPFPYQPAGQTEDWLRIEHLGDDYVQDISFTLRRGETLGLGGLMGCGRTSLAHLIIGACKAKTGHIFLQEKRLYVQHPQDAWKQGIVYISEDRKGNGLWLDFSVGFNTTLPSLKSFTYKTGHINTRKELTLINDLIQKINIKTKSPHTTVGTLSGGNQQKVAIARALMTKPSVLILDEPTRGIDIGARREIYTLINQLKKAGTAILLISSDMPELLSLSDRVMVLCEGKKMGTLQANEKTAENVMKLAVQSVEGDYA